MTHPVEAVIFDWGGTLTPWHAVDLGEQWRVYAREVHGVPVDSPEVSAEDLQAAHEARRPDPRGRGTSLAPGARGTLQRQPGRDPGRGRGRSGP